MSCPPNELPWKGAAASFRTQRLGKVQYEARLFGLELEKCSECGGRLRPIAAITRPDVIRRFLQSIGLPVDSPGISPPRAPPEAEMAFICPP